MAGESQEESSDGAGALGSSASSAGASGDANASASDDAPEAAAQSASTAAADGSAGGTTVSIAVYRSSFPIVEWDLNDDDASLTKAEWAWTGDLPERGTPGAAIEWEAPAGYAEPTRAGFEFAGWSTDASAPAGGYLDGSDPALAMPEGAPEAGEYRLFALWTPIEYSVVFDLSKNPGLGDGPLADDLLDLAWESDQQAGRTVMPLGEGRYRVDGFTMREDGYDPSTRTVKLPVPTRGGYWHVGWAEPEGQSIAIDASDGWALNPVRLTQVDGTPVLTARWATGFGVTAPMSVTFGDYDKTGSPENPSQGSSGSSAADDAAQSEADDTATPGLTDQERYEGAGQAYFENTSWHDAVRMVALESTRDPSANQVLTTYDSRKASEAAVLGDGTPENPGERLLSLYPSSTPGDTTSGVHFRLDDALSEADLASFATMGERGTPSARLDVSYGLNLATDPVTGSANHGLVLDTDDYDRKPIARVSYVFAVADAVTQAPIPKAFSIVDGDDVYDLRYVKRAAEDISAKGTASQYYAQFKGYLDSGMDPGTSDPQCFVAWGDGTTYNVRIIGINHDDKADGSGKAGLTFQFVNCLNDLHPMNATDVNAGAWSNAALRKSMNEGAIWNQVPDELQGALVSVRKLFSSQNAAGAGSQAYSNDRLFLASYYELGGSIHSAWRTYAWYATREGSQYAYWRAVGVTGEDISYSALVKGTQANSGTAIDWWQRSLPPGYNYAFMNMDSRPGRLYLPASTAASALLGVVPVFCL